VTTAQNLKFEREERKVKTAIILGATSDIASNISKSLMADDWRIVGTTRLDCDFAHPWMIDKAFPRIAMPWDLLIVAIGSLLPIGEFASIHPNIWAHGVEVNALGPLRMFHHLLPLRRQGAAAVFFSGTNPQKKNPKYSAYSAAKALLVRAVEEIDAELPDIKCFTIAPGFMRTKIQVVHDVSARGAGTTHEQIYDCLLDCLARPKDEIGGKVVVVPDWVRDSGHRISA
jgi:NAD(P)-dependent dehydrogenase (short-subunit alcohol dehydrogenase family)